MATGTIKSYMINIKTKPYIRKYLIAKYGHPIPLNYSTLIGATVLGFLSKTVPTDTHQFAKDIRYKHFTRDIFFTIASSRVNNYSHGLNVTQNQTICINRFFENEFEEYLYHYTNFAIAKNPTVQRRQALQSIAESFGMEIDEDITMDCLIKAEYRKRLFFENKTNAFVLRKNESVQQSLFVS